MNHFKDQPAARPGHVACHNYNGRVNTNFPSRRQQRGQPVTQIIAVTVKGDSISCSINNKVVATHPRSDVVAAGNLKSTDGHYGLRFGHNTDAIVTDFKKTKAQ